MFANALITHEVFTNRLEVVGDTAESNAKAYADGKASTAESNAVATSTEQRNEMAKKLGYASYDDMVSAASAGNTIIEGGHLRTLLIEVVDLLAQNITLKQNGYIQSSNYAENNGVPTAGFKIDAANNNIKAVDGVFGGTINATNGVLNNVTVNGFIKSDRVYTRTIAALFFIDTDDRNTASVSNPHGAYLIANTDNCAAVVKVGTGKYVIYLRKDETDIGDLPPERMFAYAKVIFASDIVSIDDYSSLGYEFRNSNNLYRPSCRLVKVTRDPETDEYVPNELSFLAKSYTNEGYPHPIEFPPPPALFDYCPFTVDNSKSEPFLVAGLISTDNNADQYVSLVGGCHVLIDIVYYNY